MKNSIALFVIAAFVIIVGAVIIYGRSLVRIDLEKKLLHRRRVENAEREEMAEGPWPSRSSTVERAPYKREAPGSSPGGTTDDDTRTWPKMPGVEP